MVNVVLRKSARCHNKKRPTIEYQKNFARPQKTKSFSTETNKKKKKKKRKRVKKYKKDEVTSIEEKQCKICMTNRMKVLFLPCRHLLSCSTCSKQCNSCPVCRKNISSKIHIFIC